MVENWSYAEYLDTNSDNGGHPPDGWKGKHCATCSARTGRAVPWPCGREDDEVPAVRRSRVAS